MTPPDESVAAEPAVADLALDSEAALPRPVEAPAPARKRPKPGERRVQILHTLASMLEQPGADRVTTAALAAKLAVSEAALYRHFASKAQMFEGLIDFIEQTVFTLIDEIAEREADADRQVQKLLGVVLTFGEKNPGMTRVMVGDALVFENERLVARMNQFFDRIESQLRSSLARAAEARAPTDVEDGGAESSASANKNATTNANANAKAAATATAQASVLTAFLLGRLQRYARSGFRRMPTEHLDVALRLLARAEGA